MKIENKSIQLGSNSIAFWETDAQSSSTLIFIHANSSSKDSFYELMKSMPYQHSVAIDLHGHGKSSPLEDKSQYNLPTYTKLIKDFVEQKKLSNVTLVGHCLGGHIAIESLPLFDNQVERIVTWSTPPLESLSSFATAFLPTPLMSYLFQADTTLEQINDLATTFYDQSFTLHDLFLRDFLRTDPKARETLGASLHENNFLNEIETLNNFSGEKVIIYGSQDKIVDPQYFLKEVHQKLEQPCKFIMKNYSHSPHLDNITEFYDVFHEVISGNSTQYQIKGQQPELRI